MISRLRSLASRRSSAVGEPSEILSSTEFSLSSSERWKENDLVFPNSVGNPGDPSNLRIDFDRVLAEAGISKIRFHDLRHTAASLLLNHGVPVIVVSKMLGHSKPSVTLDIYGHLYQESQDQAAELMDRLVAPIPVQWPKEAKSEVENVKGSERNKAGKD